jgi:hypothetical protein
MEARVAWFRADLIPEELLPWGNCERRLRSGMPTENKRTRSSVLDSSGCMFHGRRRRTPKPPNPARFRSMGRAFQAFRPDRSRSVLTRKPKHIEECQLSKIPDEWPLYKDGRPQFDRTGDGLWNIRAERRDSFSTVDRRAYQASYFEALTCIALRKSLGTSHYRAR